MYTILILISLMLKNGPREPVPPEECKDGCPKDHRSYNAHSFHLRVNPSADELQANADEILKIHIPAMLERWFIQIKSVETYAKETGKPVALVYGRWETIQFKANSREFVAECCPILQKI